MKLCSICHAGRLQKQPTTYLEWYGETLLVVNQMPALVCDVCGERSYDHDALENLQRLLWSGPLHASRKITEQNRISRSKFNR